MNTKFIDKHPTTILGVSRRTKLKILKRAGIGCSLCGWSLASCDIHHIIPISEGGSDDMENLICVCPNCHRAIHVLGEQFKSKSELKSLSLSNTIPNWKELYNSRLSYSGNGAKQCKFCKTPILATRTFCSSACWKKSIVKIDWDNERVLNLLSQSFGNMSKISRILGVSDVALVKYCKRSNIDYKSYKHKK